MAPSSAHKALAAALQWHIDAGADEALADTPPGLSTPVPAAASTPVPQLSEALPEIQARENAGPLLRTRPEDDPVSPATVQGSPHFRAEALALASAAATLTELEAAISRFDGLDIKRTAKNLVFSDGCPEAPVMLIGDAPGADEDRLGKPFAGASGHLLDRILKCVGRDRTSVDPRQAIYIANILNWRPPGNRTPSPAEVEISLPFIERQIALVKPRLLILAGGVSAKALLGSEASISRLRGKWHDYRPRTEGIAAPDTPPIPAIATYHPPYLLQTPSQKRAVWQDMILLQKKCLLLGL